MIFAPFTGVDNHGKIVIFGVGLLSKEDVESYCWIFEKFKKCMGRCPDMIITDQDPAMIQAVPKILQGARHHLCMWHITKKIPEKLPFKMRQEDTLFHKEIHQYIWSESIEPSDFERGCGDVMEKYDLKDHPWFLLMFNARESWIPAYFRDYPLSGLPKTTSLSESSNSFFGRYLNRCSNFVEFFMQYDSALEAQRHAHDQLNFGASSSISEMKTPWAIEKHALEIYSLKIFLDIQKDIFDACFKCRVLAIDNNEASVSYKIADGANLSFEAVFNSIDNAYICSCKKFIRVGILCSHIFVVFKHMNVNEIPSRYVLNRWTKGAALNKGLDVHKDVSKNCAAIEERKLVMNQIYSQFYSIVGLVDGNPEKMSEALNVLQVYRESLSTLDSTSQTSTLKRKLFETIYGSNAPDTVFVLPPLPVKTKGGGTRLRSGKELAIEHSNKSLRLCRKCNKKTNHDSRNCDKVSGSAGSMSSV